MRVVVLVGKAAVAWEGTQRGFLKRLLEVEEEVVAAEEEEEEMVLVVVPVMEVDLEEE